MLQWVELHQVEKANSIWVFGALGLGAVDIQRAAPGAPESTPKITRSPEQARNLYLQVMRPCRGRIIRRCLKLFHNLSRALELPLNPNAITLHPCTLNHSHDPCKDQWPTRVLCRDPAPGIRIP